MKMKKEILVAVAGLTPQVITETLYYLTQVKKPKSKISEICILTTIEGKEEVLDKLLNYKKGKFFEFCSDYKIKPSSVKFDESSIILLEDSKGNPLCDIRTVKDNERVADQITEFIREKTKNSNAVLHCSIAGGRKTLSVCLAYALMLFGRPRDTLFHILVDEKSERDKAFFYPRKNSKKKPAVDLVEIPYVRLRDKIKNLFGSEKLSFSNMVRYAQREIDAIPILENLEVDLKKRCVRIGEMEITLPPKQLALYAYFADRRRTLSPETSFDQLKKGGDAIPRGEVESYIHRILPSSDMRKYRHGIEQILQDISKINRKIDDTLNNSIVSPYYKISAQGGYGATRYGIRIDKSRIKPIVLP